MKFRKKPVVIEAEQFFADKKPWPAGVEQEMGAACSDPQCGDSTWDHDCDAGGPTGRIIIKTLEGPHIVTDGDWIITGVKGEKYPCKPDIFEATYDTAEANSERHKTMADRIVHTYDHPEANGRTPEPGDTQWSFTFQLQDGTNLEVRGGKISRDAFRQMFGQEEADDARDVTTKQKVEA